MPINVRRIKQDEQYRELYEKSLVARKNNTGSCINNDNNNNNNNNDNNNNDDENDSSTDSTILPIQQDATVVISYLLNQYETNIQILNQRNDLCALIRRMGKNTTIQQRNQLKELEDLYSKSFDNFPGVMWLGDA